MANSYDIFLSFKATDQCGSTQDVAVANELYNRLNHEDREYGLKIEHRDLTKDALRGK